MVFGCTEEGQPANNTTSLPIIVPANNTTLIPSSPQGLPSDYSVNLGDKISVNYTLWVDGKVYDTNNETLAIESGIYNPYRVYGPFVFDVIFNQGVIDGFVANVIGMTINETISFAVTPDRGYGYYDETKVITVPRYYNKSLFETVPLSYFEEQGLNTSVGTGFDTPYGTVFINSTNEENATLFYVLSPGQKFTFNGIPQEVVNLTNFTATIEYTFKQNSTYVIPHPQTGAPTSYLVTNKTEQNITLDANHKLANKTLIFEVTLLDAIPYNS